MASRPLEEAEMLSGAKRIIARSGIFTREAKEISCAMPPATTRFTLGAKPRIEGPEK
jgi:hypothetical protein